MKEQQKKTDGKFYYSLCWIYCIEICLFQIQGGFDLEVYISWKDLIQKFVYMDKKPKREALKISSECMWIVEL